MNDPVIEAFGITFRTEAGQVVLDYLERYVQRGAAKYPGHTASEAALVNQGVRMLVLEIKQHIKNAKGGSP